VIAGCSSDRRLFTSLADPGSVCSRCIAELRCRAARGRALPRPCSGTNPRQRDLCRPSAPGTLKRIRPRPFATMSCRTRCVRCTGETTLSFSRFICAKIALNERPLDANAGVDRNRVQRAAERTDPAIEFLHAMRPVATSARKLRTWTPFELRRCAASDTPSSSATIYTSKPC
jgi:hypothetical protein